MTPAELHELIAELRSEPVCGVEKAAAALSIGRTLAYRLARERGELCEGVRVIRVGSRLVVPTRPILAALGYAQEPAHVCACAKAAT